MGSEKALKRCREFLSVADQFQLGDLETEQSHPASRRLSRLALENTASAVGILKLIDTSALTALLEREEELKLLAERIRDTLQRGNRIFLCGCGATGRLSLALETLWRAEQEGTPLEERVVGFMAGGDVALIRSIENFEDYPAYAERQLFELGFSDGDLLISCTEGGETPFVIGATEKALELSRNDPFFLYCNPDEQLRCVAERSRRVIENHRIESISLLTGPMAISGSTRMQASTVLMAAVGTALFLNLPSPPEPGSWFRRLIRHWERIDLTGLQELIVEESDRYEENEYLLYETDGEYGISVLTDTTERAPTFSLHPFESAREGSEEALSLCYLLFPRAENSLEAWKELLRREPRTLEWPEIGGVASRDRLLNFDFSRRLIERRMETSGGTPHHRFRIGRRGDQITLELRGSRFSIPTGGLGRLGEHLLLKMVLNIHSTLIMGRLGRYEGNVMTWVRPSNLKLIDRSIRYVELLLRRSGLEKSYSEIAERLFEVDDGLPPDQSLVLAIVESFCKENALAQESEDPPC